MLTADEAKNKAHIFESDSVALITQDFVPVSSCEILRSMDTAGAVARGRIELHVEQPWGLVFNRAYDEATQRFSKDYNGSQASSAHFSRYCADLADRLASRHALHGKHILEVGCGDGHFLRQICRRAEARGTGIDPAWSGHDEANLRFLAERLSRNHADLRPDFVICRHTLEHIGDPFAFLVDLAVLLSGRKDAVLYLDVPDCERIAEEGAFWDIYYEHRNYFTARSLGSMMRAAGFAIEEMAREYDGQYLCATARIAGEAQTVPCAIENTSLLPDAFATELSRNISRQLAAWKAWFSDPKRRETVLWGGGSKAVAFISALGLGKEISAVVDINPDKQGCYLAGSGHPVISPAELKTLSVSDLIVMNPAYHGEITAVLEELGIGPAVWLLGVAPDRSELHELAAAAT